MNEVWVTNASPVITLAKAGFLELLTQLPAELLLPEPVLGRSLLGRLRARARSELRHPGLEQRAKKWRGPARKIWLPSRFPLRGQRRHGPVLVERPGHPHRARMARPSAARNSTLKLLERNRRLQKGRPRPARLFFGTARWNRAAGGSAKLTLSRIHGRPPCAAPNCGLLLPGARRYLARTGRGSTSTLVQPRHHPAGFERIYARIGIGQASWFMSLVTLVAWFGPAVYMKSVGPSDLAVLVVGLVVQLGILNIEFVLSKGALA